MDESKPGARFTLLDGPCLVVYVLHVRWEKGRVSGCPGRVPIPISLISWSQCSNGQAMHSTASDYLLLLLWLGFAVSLMILF